MGSLRKVLRDISHNISGQVCVMLASVGFLQQKLDDSGIPEVKDALRDLEVATGNTAQLARDLERETRASHIAQEDRAVKG